MKKSFIYIVALTLIAACNKVESPAPSQGSDVITAQIEQETATRTYMDAVNNIRWSEGDQVVAFMKSSYGHKYQLKSGFAGKVYADSLWFLEIVETFLPAQNGIIISSIIRIQNQLKPKSHFLVMRYL